MSLLERRIRLADAQEQRRILEDAASLVRPFDDALRASALYPLKAAGIEILQINVGKFCNQTCRHCHVDAGPDRKEIMSVETAELCLAALEATEIPTVDITGGAPELVPVFRPLVLRSRSLGRRVIHRCNLTALQLPSQSDLAGFLAANRVEVVASLPYFLADRTDAQRGKGVFEKSIDALRTLNALGYGNPGSGLVLNLVYNPVGAFLSPPQAAIEADFKRELKRRYGIEFNSLYTITNMPISRFLEFLLQSGNFDAYMERLANAYNPAAAQAVMCRNTISVGWDGTLYDCDFNQMLDIKIGAGLPRHIRDFSYAQFQERAIVTGRHCYGCTAGSGSSCSGATAGA